jgi:hypothetical protein
MRIHYLPSVMVSGWPDLYTRGVRSVFLRYLEKLSGYPTVDTVLAAYA